VATSSTPPWNHAASSRPATPAATTMVNAAAWPNTAAPARCGEATIPAQASCPAAPTDVSMRLHRSPLRITRPQPRLIVRPPHPPPRGRVAGVGERAGKR
jgi:hypothetical protein